MESMKLDCLGDKNRMISTKICESDQFLVRISWKMYGFLTVSGRISVSKPQKFSPAALPGQVLLIRSGFQKIVLSRPGSMVFLVFIPPLLLTDLRAPQWIFLVFF